MFEPQVERLIELDDVSERYLDAATLDTLSLSTFEARVAAGWTAALCAKDDELRTRAARTVPFFQYAAVGFVDRAVDPLYAEAAGLPPFGVIFYADELPPGSADDAYLRREEPFVHEETGVVFPVVVRRGLYTEATDVARSSAAGQLACWASTRVGAYWGWLTARHVATHLGTVVDYAPECTDAAIVDNGDWPRNLSKHLAIRLAPGDGAHLHFHQGVVPATVLDVSIDFDIYKSPKFPVRFSLSKAGVSGNSGALITEAATQQPMGVYTGSFTPWTASTGTAASGCALAIYQLETMLDLEVYR